MLLSKSTKNRIISGIILIGVVALNIKLIDIRMQAEAQILETPTYSQIPSFSQKVEEQVEDTSSEVEEKEIEVQVDTVQEEPVISAMTYTESELEPYMEMGESDVYELATLVYLESGTESFECQKAIASVVIHRMQNDDLTLQEVIYAKNQFSPAYLIAQSEPSESTLQAVREVLQDGPTIPNYVTFFRADYYHDWSELIIPYCTIDHTYFSADVRLMD